MFLLTFVVLSLFMGVEQPSQNSHEFLAPGFNYSWGLLISGFFVGIASADVWQRLFAAKGDEEANKGFVLGAFALLIYGGIILAIGMKVANLAPHIDSNNAFFKALELALPGSLGLLGTALLLSALVSTADTEIFVLTTMLCDFISKKSPSYSSYLNVNPSKAIGMVLFGIVMVAALAAIWADNLLLIYTWLLYALISISPVLWMAIRFRISDWAASCSVIVNWLVLFLLICYDYLTIETIYYYVLPCIATAILALIATKPKFNAEIDSDK